jgi:iron complex outermembrane recepter protein
MLLHLSTFAAYNKLHMAKLILLFNFLLLLGLVGNAQSLSGKITDNETKAGIPFARIQIEQLHLNTLTDENGNYHFHTLPNSKLKIKISIPDYETLLLLVPISGETTMDFQLIPKHTVFEEHIVSASDGRLQKENITAIEYQSKEKLFETGASTLGEALVNIPGVQQSTIGTGISRPVIRGLSGMRVVTFWNGLRIENQQWGEDHGMGASELGMKGVEVIKGPASLLYGADALGGVIHFIDEDYVMAGTHKLSASSRIESNAHATVNELGYQTNNGKWKFNVFGNYLSYKDFQLPDGRYLANSRFWGTNLKSSLGFRHNNYVFNLRYHGTFSKIGLPGHTHDVDPDPETFLSNRRGFRPLTLPFQMIQNHFLQLENKLFFKRSDLTLNIGQTLNNLMEFDHDRDIAYTNLSLTNSVYHIKYNYHITEKLSLFIGAQGMLQINRNRLPTLSYLIPDANTLDNGAYAMVSYEIQKWRIQGGLRVDHRSIQSLSLPIDTNLILNIDPNPLNRSFTTFNYSAGAVRNTKRTTLRMNASSGFRAPHMAELLASGVHHGSMRFEQGDRNLQAEQGIQLDLALELHFDHLEVIINPYFSAISNFIYLNLTDSMVSNPIGNFPIFQFSQVDQAYLYGGEIAFHYHPHQLHRLHLESNFSITLAEDAKGNYINLIPQPNANTRIRFDIKNKGFVQIKSVTAEHQFFMAQNRVATYEKLAPAFHLIHLAMNTTIHTSVPIQLSLGVRNLLNETYIWHLSPLKNLGGGVPQPGINLFVKISADLSWNKR